LKHFPRSHGYAQHSHWFPKMFEILFASASISGDIGLGCRSSLLQS
jgi:hypothetical protein